MTAVSVNPEARTAWPQRLHADMIEDVVGVMRERLNEPWTLDELSRLAHLSPYHFNRTFARITGVPPFKFLAALRMAEAKRLLLTTDLSVTVICLEVGYRSLGTFTTHFSEMVGVPPRGFRRLVELFAGASFEELATLACGLPAEPKALHVPLEIHGAQGWAAGPIFVGAFASPLPRGRPAACRLVDAPGDWSLPISGPGAFRIFAAALEHAVDPLEVLLPPPENMLVAQADVPAVKPDMSPVRLQLRSSRPLDPPIVTAFPYALWRLVDEHEHGDADDRRRRASADNTDGKRREAPLLNVL